MKIKSGFFLKKLGNQYVAVALGDASKNFNGIIKLNSTGAYIWEHLQKDTSIEELTKSMCQDYNIDYQTASNDILEVINIIKNSNLLDT